MFLEEYKPIKVKEVEYRRKNEEFYERLGRPIGLGLPTEPLEIKKSWSLEEVFTIIYTLTDDAYKKLFGKQSYFRTSNNSEPNFSDAEIITLAIVAELAGYESRNGWWSHVSKNYRYLFPDLCSLTRYGRRLVNLSAAMEKIRRHILFLMNVDLSQLRVVDSFPLEICHLRRVNSSSQPFDYYATFGYCAAKKEFFYGFRIHMVASVNGVPLGYLLTPGHVHDTKGLAFLMQDMSQLDRFLDYLPNIAILGDKGYVGDLFARQLKEAFGIEMLAINREYDKDLPTSSYNELIGKTRKIIETSISVLTGTMNAAKTFARSINGLLTNIVSKMTAFNFANYLNQLIGQPDLHISSIVN